MSHLPDVVRDALRDIYYRSPAFNALFNVFSRLSGRPYNRSKETIQNMKRAASGTVEQARYAVIGKAMSISPADYEGIRQKAEEKLDRYYQEDCERDVTGNPMGMEDRITLQMLLQMIQPTTCVETGTASGASASVILARLDELAAGRLHSIDIDRGDGRNDYGACINPDLLGRWQLHLQAKKTTVLPNLLNELGQIDFFLHDSRHNVRQMMWEYKLAWQYLSPGGVLASHDILNTTAFDYFGAKYRDSISGGGGIGNFGFWVKGQNP